MKVVVGTNILFSALLSSCSKYRDLLFDDTLKIYSPNFVFLEIFRHKEKILKCTKESEAAVYEFLGSILKRVIFIKEDLISEENFMKAFSMCREIDEADTPFVALALELDAYLLSGDEKLKKTLLEKGFKKFFQNLP
ncbi:MAG: nucleotide-binding protein [Nitrospirae bacterium]|nr:MAG: nucleotide-binding protein [Nitrospirota bacterium]